MNTEITANITHLRTIELPNDTGHMEGDILSFLLKDGEPIEAMAVKQESNGTVYITVDCLTEEYALQKDGDFVNGYEGSDLRKNLNGKILKRFPKKLRKMMVPFNNGDLLRIPTEREIFGENNWSEEEPESAEQFKPMKLLENRIAGKGHNGTPQWYWLQNRNISWNGHRLNYNAVFIGSLGCADTWDPSDPLCIRLLFKIRNEQ